ncbi:hypothetical protein KY890_004230 [Vibrio vulnificus]|nr:hypothetical protein [Vibrio vulnificus]HAS8389390.1 hypothetical protein [Vibrio vulnificus]
MFLEEEMIRTRLVQLLFVISLVNVYLDHGDLELRAVHVVGNILVGLFSIAPAAISQYVAAKIDFELRGVRIYQLAADIVLGVSGIFFLSVLFVVERSEYHPGASHMYVVTWPVLFGILALVLYLVCVIIHKVTDFKNET